jgi:RNA polymerase sigma factor (sigma-70 family)
MTKNDLKEYQYTIKNIELLKDQLDIIDSKLTNTTHTFSHLPKHKSKIDMTNEWVSKRIEIENTINKNLAKAYANCNRIEQAIESLPQREKYLMRLRYIQGLVWEKICQEMNCSWRRIHSIHLDALRMIANK